MPQYQLGGSMIVGSGQVASSNNGFDPQMRTRDFSAVGQRTRTASSVSIRTRTRRA